jgi:competence protein ComEA
MADLPLLGVPAASSPPPPPPPPTWTPAARWSLLALSGLALLLLGWRGYGLSRWSADPATIERGVVPLSPIDLNRASQAQLATVPGLGETMAGRIVKHREEYGAFRTVEELRRVQGIGEKTLGRVRPFLQVASYRDATAPPVTPPPPPAGQSKKPPPGVQIDINRAGLTELQQLPGIGPVLAARILEERHKRPFASVEELRRVKGIGVKTMDKIRPHATAGDREP